MNAYVNEDGYLVLDAISTGIKIVSAKHYQKLVTRIEALKEENESLQSDNESLQNRLQLTIAKALIAEDERDSLKKEVEKQNAHIEDLTHRRDVAVRRSDELSGQVKLLEKQLKEKESIIYNFDTLLGAVATFYSKDTEVVLNAGYWNGIFEMRHKLFIKNNDDFNKNLSELLEENKALAEETAELCSDTKGAVSESVNVLMDKFKQSKVLG